MVLSTNLECKMRLA